MPIRSFVLPQDLDTMNSLVLNGFQYPENPAWSIQEDEKVDIIDRVRGAKRIWPILRFMRILSPALRDILQGFIHEQDGKAVGLINYMKPPVKSGQWMIANVAVLPEYRRRGIARQLVHAVISVLRERRAKCALLEVVEGNLPAFDLYKELGFETYARSMLYECMPDVVIPSMPIPHGWSILPLSDSHWRVRYKLALRTTPETVKRFEPVEQSKYRVPLPVRMIRGLFESFSGSRRGQLGLCSPEGSVVGCALYSLRIHPGGINHVDFDLDPEHSELAGFFISHALTSIRGISSGRRIEIDLRDWQTPLISAVKNIGCATRFSAHCMGLIFQ